MEELQKERTTTIDKLKAATKYNSTQELLEKYGGASPSESTPKQRGNPGLPDKGPNTPRGGPKPQRTGIAPPPTANIQRGPPIPAPSTPVAQTPAHVLPSGKPPYPGSPVEPSNSDQLSPTEEFAPNAFGTQSQYSAEGGGHQWYDRILDVILGEDETLPKNRLVLICKNCRLVNGQAPPGVKQLSDIGQWRCSGCGIMNGEQDEATKIVAEVQATAKKAAINREEIAPNSEDEPQEVGGSDESDDAQKVRRRSKRKTAKG
jgi:endoplasmic reticulum junction formation protein lunapark